MGHMGRSHESVAAEPNSDGCSRLLFFHYLEYSPNFVYDTLGEDESRHDTSILVGGRRGILFALLRFGT